MFVKVRVSQHRGKPIEVIVKGAGMVQPVEASGVKSICMLLDKRDWDAAYERLRELGVTLSYHRGRPVVNIAEVNEKSRLWCQNHPEK